MKILLPLITLLLALFTTACTKTGQSTFIHKTLSDYNATETLDRFARALSPKKYSPMHLLDHTQIATAEQKYLKPTLSLDLSNPMINTKLLECNPTMAADLPIRIGVYRELSGQVTLVYTNPEYWSLKHNIKDGNCLKLIKIMAADLDEATDAIAKKK